MRVDTLKCRVIKSFGFVRKSVAARAGWWLQMDKNNGTGKPSVVKYAGIQTHMEYSGFHTTRQWQKDIFPTPAFCRCCGGKLGCKGD